MRKRTAKQRKAMLAAQRTLNGIDFDAMFRRIRDRLNAKSKTGPRWT